MNTTITSVTPQSIMNPWKWSVLNATHVENETALLLPLRKRKPTFIANIGDLFHKEVPFEFIDKVFAVMALCPQHTFQILTKRPERMAEYFATHNGGITFSKEQDEQLAHYFPAVMVEDLCNGGESTTMRELPGWWDRLDRVKDFGVAAPPNVWLGTSCENQATADERIPHLLNSPAAIRFISCEPLLGEIDLRGRPKEQQHLCIRCGLGPEATHDHPDGYRTRGLDWIIVGGESGPNARPCVIGHIRSLVKQCKAANVPVFVKQLGSYYRDHHNIDKFPEDLRVREFPNEGMLR